MIVYTIGYKGLLPKNILGLAILLDAVVIDVRFMPFTRSNVYHRKSFVESFGNLYRWVKGFGNENYKGGPIVIHDFDGGVAAISDLIEGDMSIILMCTCGNIEECHRKLIATLLATRFTITVEHLTAADVEALMASGDA